MNWITEHFPVPKAFQAIEASLQAIRTRSGVDADNTDVLRKIFSCIDLTSLNSTDSSYSISDFVERVNRFAIAYPQMPSVAAICVFPVFAPVLNSALKVKGVKKAVVSAGFPSSQTFTDLKKLETRKALDFGADEVDVVISIGEFLEGNYEFVAEEIIGIREVMGAAHLKVIIESGALPDVESVWVASILAMHSGADFIKTSTGKMAVGATPESAYVMCTAIRKYFEHTGRRVGFKPAGGVANIEDALVYYRIVKEVLGDEWLSPTYFRVGASRLANVLLGKILHLENGESQEIQFF